MMLVGVFGPQVTLFLVLAIGVLFCLTFGRGRVGLTKRMTHTLCLLGRLGGLGRTGSARLERRMVKMVVMSP
jgi:hypothetical protein